MQSTATQSHDQDIPALIKLVKYQQCTITETLNAAGLPTSITQYHRLTQLINNLLNANEIFHANLPESTPLQVLMGLLPPIQLEELSRPNPNKTGQERSFNFSGKDILKKNNFSHYTVEQQKNLAKHGQASPITQSDIGKTGGFNSLETFLNFANRVITTKTVYEHLPRDHQHEEHLAFCKELGDDAETIRAYFKKPPNQIADAIWHICELQRVLSLLPVCNIESMLDKEIRAAIDCNKLLPAANTRNNYLNKTLDAINNAHFWLSCYDLLQPSEKSRAVSAQIEQDHDALTSLLAQDAFNNIAPKIADLVSQLKDQAEMPHTIITENLPLLLAIIDYVKKYPDTCLTQQLKEGVLVLDNNQHKENASEASLSSPGSLNYSNNSLTEPDVATADVAEGDLSGTTDPELSAISNIPAEQSSYLAPGYRATTPTGQPIGSSPNSVQNSPGSPTNTMQTQKQEQSQTDRDCQQPLRVYGSANSHLQFPSFTADSKPAKRKNKCRNNDEQRQNKSTRSETGGQQPSRSTTVTA